MKTCELCGGFIAFTWRGCGECAREIPQGDDPRWIMWANELEDRGRAGLAALRFSRMKIDEIEAWIENEAADRSAADVDGCKKLLRAVISQAVTDRDEAFLVEIVGTTPERAREAIRRAQAATVNT